MVPGLGRRVTLVAETYFNRRKLFKQAGVDG
jgi:hypothetical protein